MERYLVVSTHTAEDCRKAIRHFREYHATYLTHFEWGCMDGDHQAYAILEAENHDMAKMSVPPLLRHKAKVIKLTTFDPNSKTDPVHDAIK